MVEGGMKCVRFLLFAFNILFVLLAMALIGTGAYVQIAMKEYFGLIDGQFSSAAVLLIVVGVLIFFIASFGCFGAIKQNRVLVLIYAGLLIIIFILEISGGIAGFVLRNNVQEKAEVLMEKTIKQADHIQAWGDIQHDFKCCGIHSYKDWYVNPNYSDNSTLPDSCCDKPPCNETNHYTAGKDNQGGCLTKLTEWIQDHIYYVGAVGIAFAFIQLIGILFACCLARAIKKEYQTV